MLFGEPPAVPQGKLAEAVHAMTEYARRMHHKAEQGEDRDHKARTREVWTQGLISSLDELEQSCDAAGRYCELITSPSLDAMPPEERLNYRRYVYFDKNAFIRLFALLDKLGTFLNDTLELNTEAFKPHFSYFTVLRRMRRRSCIPLLPFR